MNAPLPRVIQSTADDPLWYKDAIIYQLHVKSFCDSNNDGVGDFPGLMSRLDYIAELGVNAVWLLPFYPSPRLDDGYDISDYRMIHPEYGTMSDFKRFVAAAHARGIGVMRFWLELGVDGLRLDAVPYLIERDGTNNENLPETHQVLKRIRAELDASYPGRMLLAEANQWPEDTKDYFGDGDECHMAFHFPLMPRMYVALAREDRFPITDIMRQTPQIPENCQWAVFLRNHDELTLEMVTDSERDYLWETYASDRRARLNLGIRRRLTPLLERDRRRIELMNCLLRTL